MQRVHERLAHENVQFGRKPIRHRTAKGLKMARDRRDALPEKSLEDRFERNFNPMPLQQLRQALACERFAVDQHAVAVEDDQVVAGRGSGRGSMHDFWLVEALTNATEAGCMSVEASLARHLI